jgi:hypothetical protein
MATKDKRVQTILQYLNPFDCFEEVCQALRGLDFPVEMLLEWMYESDFKNEQGEYYTERRRYDEREKVTRFKSFKTLSERQEGDHVRGYSTLIQLWSQLGYNAIQLEDLADQLEDDDVEFASGEGGKSMYTKRVKINKFYSYDKIEVSPVELPPVLMNEEEQYKTFLTQLFKSEDNLYFSMDCYGGTLVNREKAIDMGTGPVFMNVNPCTDNGNHNVTDFNYWLLEIDEDENKQQVPLEVQYAWMLASKLPIATITFSGGKSLHALVRINASDHEDFRDRVEEVRDYCVQLGMPLDCRVIDPSRYTRVPGTTAVGRSYQSLLAWNVGSKNYDSWLIDRIYYLKSQEENQDEHA